MQEFQSTRPVWGATRTCPRLHPALHHFNPRAPYGARHVAAGLLLRKEAFQSTRPVWGATLCELCSLPELVISIHAPRMGRDVAAYLSGRHNDISIHAPRMGRDRCPSRSNSCRRYFNPRAPYGARPGVGDEITYAGRISIHAPRMGRDRQMATHIRDLQISIHAPRMGRDT